jgi:hypothetical protein
MIDSVLPKEMGNPKQRDADRQKLGRAISIRVATSGTGGDFEPRLGSAS